MVRLQGDAESTPREAAYRMRDLVRLSGLTRETIHHYLAERLLPPPLRAGRNTAVYGEEHLRRLRRIRELQAEQFLPLRAIRAVLEGEEDPGDEFTPAQRALIQRMRATVGADGGGEGRIALSDVKAAVTAAEIAELAAAGLIEVQGTGRKRTVGVDDARIVEAWGRLKGTGIDPAHGFSPRHARTHLEAIERIVRYELELFSERYAGARGEEAMRIADRAIPILNELLGLLHRKKFREFVSGFPLGEASEPKPGSGRSAERVGAEALRPRRSSG
jgi:DNA-binding transcriptional MerR regulator